MVDKLAKALDGLKNVQFSSLVPDKSVSKKEKMFFCVLATDVLVSHKPLNLQFLPVVIENLIILCDDADSDVRMVADESLNRIIMSLSESNILKVQVEILKIIKKNGPARCLRAALVRFDQLSHHIRPTKGRVHAQMLIPCLIEISKREEESIHETLASSFENIFRVLGVFVQDNSLKNLIKAFLNNLSSTNPVIRRCSASCITTLVQYCRKPHIFNSFVLNSLLDCIVPIHESNSSDLILGVLGCLRLLLPHLSSVKCDEGISGSFGIRRKHDESLFAIDRLIQIYELCLHYTRNTDHNVTAAALETLNQILQNPPHQLVSFLLSPSGFSRSYIHSMKENKIWSRAGSEMSVASSHLPLDESLLFDDSDISQLSDFSVSEQSGLKELSSKFKDKFTFSEDDLKTVENPLRTNFVFDKTFGSQNILDNDSDAESSIMSGINTPPLLLIDVDGEEKDVKGELERSRTNSLDNLYSPNESDLSNTLTHVDIGSFSDAAVPLIYCVRLIAALFLLDSSPNCLKSDRSTRVSIKLLALSCISAIVKYYPVVLKMNLSKTQNDYSAQKISDILLYASHCDPQIRGCVNILVGSLVQSALLESEGFGSDWLNESSSVLNFQNLIGIILKGLEDKSSICSRQALSAIKICINTALLAPCNYHFLPLLEYLPSMTDNSYWLVKVKLVEILSGLPYVIIHDMTMSNTYQEEVIDCVLMPLLGDKDARVRSAAAEALVSIIPVLYDGKSTVVEFAKPFTDDLNRWLKSKTNISSAVIPCQPFSFAFTDPWEIGCIEKIELSLSKIVSKLSKSILVSKNKHFLFGYVEALKLLTENYPATVYLKAWNCSKPKTENSENDYLPSDLVTFVYSLLESSPLVLDLTCYSNATVLLGNLFAGHCIVNLKNNYHVSFSSGSDQNEKLWDVFKSGKLVELAEEIFTHLLKVLNVYSSLVEEVSQSNIAESSVAANTFLPLLSPIKKQEEKAEEKKSKNGCSFRQTTQYGKLHQLLKNGHANYKVSLDKSVADKFLNLLDSTLYTLSILLEVATVQETGRCAEEILSYLRTTISLRSNSVVCCVIQLLKSLFGINLASSWEDKKLSSLNYRGLNLFDSIYQLPTEYLSEKILRRANQNSLECDNLSGHYRRPERKIIIKNTDKNWLATYIRLFEPMVVKSLQLYTITGNVSLQSNVLRLLNQLIQLRVNYCLLDAKQVFVGFVLKQFELLEQGQIPGIEILLPHIFKFLILLSYEKQHSKPIMSVPKILQLCDGLMASDQPVQIHCIPALIPVVEDVFLFRSLAEDKDLETQREVLLSMLLRLAEFPQVMDMLTSILNETKMTKEKEKWKRWSRKIVDVILPLANQDRLRIDVFEGQNSFINLMSSLSPNVLRPIDPLLKALFVEPADYNCSISVKLWLSKVTVILETIFFVKEDVFLNRLSETPLNVNLSVLMPNRPIYSPDPFNVNTFFQSYDPAETTARFILKIISVVTTKILESFSSSLHLQQKLSMFFVCVFHILKSGTFHRITNSLQRLLTKERDSLALMFCQYKMLIHICPLLTCQFSYFLTLLNFCDQNYWNEILREPATLSEKLVQWCAVISLSDYLCDNLSDMDTFQYLLTNNIREVIVLSHEIPIKELLMTIRRRKSFWSLLIGILSSKDFEKSEPELVEKSLRLLEVTDNSHASKLLHLLINKYLISSRLALSLLAGSIACRQVEFLLTLPKDEVVEQIDEHSFNALKTFFNDRRHLKRHFNLWGLLNKLGHQVFQSASPDNNRPVTVNTNELKSIKLKEDWYFNQVKERCCQKNSSGIEMASLLRNLDRDRILEIFSTSEFNKKILKDCLVYHKTLGHEPETQECESTHHESPNTENSLFTASKYRLLGLMSEIGDEFRKLRKEFGVPINTPRVLEKLYERKCFYDKIWEVAPGVTVMLEIILSENVDIDDQYVESLTEFGMSCIEIIAWEIGEQKHGRRFDVYLTNLENSYKCGSAILKSQKIRALLCQTSNRERLKRCIDGTIQILRRLLPCNRFGRMGTREKDELMSGDLCYQLSFLLDLVSTKSNLRLLPDCMVNSIRDFIVNICRLPEFSLHILKVPESGEMQEIEMLESFIMRFSVIGWSSRQQFEEIWVALLAVLGFNTQGDIPAEENGFIVQASAIAVEGITTLLKNTMLEPGGKKLIHHGRDSLSMKHFYEKLPLISSTCENDQFCDRSYHFLDNLEIPKRDDRHIHGLLSVEYLWTAVKQISNRIDIYEKHTAALSTAGLDIPSCIHLLTELFNQWISQTSPDIKIITSSLKSSIVISDLFTDIAQFQWLLNFCLQIDDIVIDEDIVVLPLIILGSAKAGATVLPDRETCEKIKRLMLRSSSYSCRVATVQGLLYLLQSYVVCYTINHTALPPPGSTFQRDEANFVANIVDTFLPVALEVLQQFKLERRTVMEEYDRCHWSLIFYLLQNYQSSLGDLKEEFLSFIVGTLRSKCCSDSLMALLIRGIERLLLTTIIDENFRDQVSKISLEIISHGSVATCRHGLQLLMVLSYLDKKVKDIRQLVTGQEDPEKVMKDMEKINILFEKLKKSYPREADVVGEVLTYVLMDFTASDVLTKVIQEFLSSHQPHQKILAGLLFKVFERAELSLLEDWVVFSLPSFIQGMPVSMSIWTLNCFFVSASNEPWLKSLFPLVQSRIRMAEEEDRKLLCLSGTNFYKQLKLKGQKISFVQAFEKAAQTDAVFTDLLSSLH